MVCLDICRFWTIFRLLNPCFFSCRSRLSSSIAKAWFAMKERFIPKTSSLLIWKVAGFRSESWQGLRWNTHFRKCEQRKKGKNARFGWLAPVVWAAGTANSPPNPVIPDRLCQWRCESVNSRHHYPNWVFQWCRILMRFSFKDPSACGKFAIAVIASFALTSEVNFHLIIFFIVVRDDWKLIEFLSSKPF